MHIVFLKCPHVQIFEIPQLWKSGFSRVYSSRCCSCSFEPENIKIGQSSHKMYSNNTLNCQESTTTLNAWTIFKILETYWMHHISISTLFKWANKHLIDSKNVGADLNDVVNVKSIESNIYIYIYIYIYICGCVCLM